MFSLSVQPETSAHRVPVGIKLFVLLLISIVLFRVESIAVLAFCLLGVAGLYAVFGRSFFLQGLKLLRPLIWVGVALLGYHIFIQDMVGGIHIVLRMFVLVGLANFVTMTSRLEDMRNLIMWFLQPLSKIGVNTAAIALAFTLVIRFTPVLFTKASEMAMAWRARSPKRANWRLILPISLVAIDDAEHISQALRARGGISRK